MNEIYPNGGNVLKAPLGIAMRGQMYLGNFLRGSVGVFLPSETPKERMVKMARTQPLHEASLGVNAMHRGEKLGQNDLILMGRLMVARSVVKTEIKTEMGDIPVPETVTAEVVDIALEEEIYPAVNRYLPVLALDQTRKVLEKFDPTRNVIPLFPNPQS